jgi:Cu-processing system permease protein
MSKVIRFVLLDILRNRIVLFYTLALGIFTWSAFSLESNESRGVLTLLNIILFTVPLVSILFSTIYLYNSAEFIQLLVSQPIRRSVIWLSLYAGLALSMTTAFLLAAGIPLLIYAPGSLGLTLLFAGVMVSLVFTGLAFLCVMLSRDKARGIGYAILSWLYFALLFDGLVLFLLFQFSDYPIEKLMVGLTAFSPLDLARIMVLLQLDASALMGYTGALFRQYFGTGGGLSSSALILIVWSIIPVWISLRRFRSRDL